MADRFESAGERRWRLFLWLCAALRGDAPTWPADPADTQPLIALAGDHFVTPTLAVALEGAPGLPDLVRDYLDAVLLLNRERNAQILGAVEIAAVCLAEAGVKAVFLKGAAHLADGLYSDPAARFLGDVDLIVPHRDEPAAARALAGAGFVDRDVRVRRWVALRQHDSPMQRHPDSGVGIEVHRELGLISQRFLRSGTVLDAARPSVLRPNVLVPEPHVRALHAILHDQVDGAWRRRRCGLRMLCDVARLEPDLRADSSFMQLVRGMPRSAQRIVDHALALAGLVGLSVDPVATECACERMRLGTERPAFALSDYLVSGFVRFRFQPLAAINLLDPLRWPERLARMWPSNFD